jgi:divinyl protochlorophyllide a 8-vinyl-reductase
MRANSAAPVLRGTRRGGVAGSMRVNDDPAGTVGVIGPNAINQVAAALGMPRAGPIFQVAGLTHHLAKPPDRMVPQSDVRALHAALRGMLGEAEAALVARDAGKRTALYLLAHRIPRPAQHGLRMLPARLAARLLLAMIERHAWTFCGTAALEVSRVAGWRPGWSLAIKGCVLCRGAHAEAPLCDFYAACFGALFRALVHRSASVEEISCTAAGAEDCVFEVRWEEKSFLFLFFKKEILPC